MFQCEGKAYNDKSDVWALGCIAYEMACLQKTFESSNLPALVNKIMKGQYEQIRGNYSTDFKNLVREMLTKEPELRPSVRAVLYEKVMPVGNFGGGCFYSCLAPHPNRLPLPASSAQYGAVRRFRI